MSNILAIETSSPVCSVALKTNSSKCYVFSSQNTNDHGSVIFEFIESALDEGGILKNDLDYIALSTGPGSFTGLRIGCSVAQGLAYGLNIPILPISSLKILAQQVIDIENSLNISVIIDAHMQELYIGEYKNEDGHAEMINKDFAIEKSEFEIYSKENNESLFIGSGCNYLAEELKKNAIGDITPNANTLFKIAEKMILENIFNKPEEIILNYLSGEDHWSKS